jgi:hypothetical protein
MCQIGVSLFLSSSQPMRNLKQIAPATIYETLEEIVSFSHFSALKSTLL